MLKQEDVTVGDTTYQVKELTIGQLVEILPKLSGGESNKAQLELLRMCVCKDGVLLGDQVDGIGSSAFMAFVSAAMKVNGMAEGNE